MAQLMAGGVVSGRRQRQNLFARCFAILCNMAATHNLVFMLQFELNFLVCVLVCVYRKAQPFGK